MGKDYRSHIPIFGVSNYELSWLIVSAELNIGYVIRDRQESDGSTEHLAYLIQARVREMQEDRIQEIREKGIEEMLALERFGYYGMGFHLHIDYLALIRAYFGTEEKYKEFKKEGGSTELSDILLLIEERAKDLGDFKELPEKQEDLLKFCSNLYRSVAALYNQFYCYGRSCSLVA